MNSRFLIARALCLILLCTLAACYQKETPPRGPTPKLATDTDLGHGYVRRDGTIHFLGGGVTGTGPSETRIDTPSPALVRKAVLSKFGPFKTAEGLDAATFTPLSETHSKDKSRVYYKVISGGEFIVIVLQNADPGSFELLDGSLARDKSHVWYCSTIQQGVDPATVQPIKGGPVFKDKDSVHYQYTTIANADPASFKHLGSGYYADNNRVYWCTDPIPNADPASFKVLGDSFVAKDKNRAYRSGEPLDGYDAASLELIVHDEAGFQIYSDINGIHVNKMPFPRAKPGKTKIIDTRTVKTDNLILLVENSRNTPMTLFRENGRLMAESPSYEPSSRKVNGLISAEVTPDGLKNIKVNPLQGSSHAPDVPDWQMEVFTHAHPANRLIDLGKLIK